MSGKARQGMRASYIAAPSKLHTRAWFSGWASNPKNALATRLLSAANRAQAGGTQLLSA